MTAKLSGIESAPDFLMYFAHDVTIADHLLAIGLFNGQFPPYASAVITELHQEEDGTSFVNVSIMGISKLSCTFVK